MTKIEPPPLPPAPTPAPAALDNQAPLPEPDRRLHPWSWLFVLVHGLRQFMFPIIVLLLAGRGASDGWWELLPLLGIVVLVGISVWQYFTYRYHLGQSAIVIRSGLLQRSLRQIPYARIHNVAIHRNLLHQLFGVAEVRLESAGGQKPEAEMRVLRLDDAHALEALVRRRSQAATPAAAAGDPAQAIPSTPATADAAPQLLLGLNVGEIIRMGLISNRGMVVVAAAIALLAQTSRDSIGSIIRAVQAPISGYVASHSMSTTDWLLTAVLLLALAMLLTRTLSIGLALTQFYRFRLEQQGRRLTVERGLFSRLRSSVPRRRIQSWTLNESLMQRLFRRRSLHVETAVGQVQAQQQRGLREIAPIATIPACDGLVQHLLPNVNWPPTHWQPLHRLAWLRLLLPGLLFGALLTAGLLWWQGAWGWLGLLWWLWAGFVAYQHARRAGFSLDEQLLSVREGWLSRHWRFAEIDKLQALHLSQGPLDRLFGTATIWLDTAGAQPLSAPLRIPLLPEQQAQTLLTNLHAQIATRPLRW